MAVDECVMENSALEERKRNLEVRRRKNEE